MVNRQTGFSANRMMLGREVLKPIDILIGRTHNYVKQLTERMDKVHQVARDNLLSAQCRQKRDYDLKLSEHSYSVGDLVYVLHSATKVGQSKKLSPIWKGPLLIVEVLSPVLYRVKGRRKESVLHHDHDDRLRICKDRVVPMWMRRLRHQFLDCTISR